MTVTNEIREKIRAEMINQGITQEQLAEMLGTDQPSISRMLRKDGSGKVPDSWKKLLEALNLELVADIRKAQE